MSGETAIKIGKRSAPALAIQPIVGVNDMSKGLDRKKDEKKKPQRSLMEKRAAKRAKRENQGALSATSSLITKKQ